MLNLKIPGTVCANCISNHNLVKVAANATGVVVDGKASSSRPEFWLA